MSGEIRVYANADALARAAAGIVCKRAADSGGLFTVALAGGATPKRLYERLAAADDLPWARIHWFWGDERFVPPGDPDSNFAVARAMLAHAPETNIHAVPTAGLTAEDAARRYEETLRAFPRGGRALFDIVLLGLGEDGHTASLFPGSPALAERDRLVLCVPDAPLHPRITLTYPALASSALCLILVSGAAKRAPLAAIRAGADLPAARVESVGETLWLADAAAWGAT